MARDLIPETYPLWLQTPVEVGPPQSKILRTPVCNCYQLNIFLEFTNAIPVNTNIFSKLGLKSKIFQNCTRGQDVQRQEQKKSLKTGLFLEINKNLRCVL